MIDIPKTIELQNGLRVCVIPDVKLDSLTIHLRGLVGSNLEQGTEIGSAHLVEHLLVDNPQKNKIKSFGGKIVGVTSRDDVLFMVKILKQDIADGLDFLSEILKPRIFTKQELQTQKGIAIQEVKRSLSTPEKAITRLSRKIIYPNQRMAKLNSGSVEDIKRLNLKAVQDFHNRLYVPNNFVLVISGEVDEEIAIKYTDKFFGSFIKGKDTSAPKIIKDTNLKIQCINESSLTKAFVKVSYYSFPINDERSYSALIFSTLISNYLENFIKSTLGLAYKVSCENFPSGSYGLLSFYFSSEEKDVGNIIKHISKISENIDNIISVRAVATVKTPIVTSKIFDFERVSLRADYYSTLLLHGTKKQNHLYEIDSIEKIKAGEVRKLAYEILKQNPKITVMSRDLKEEDIKSYLQE